MRSFSGDSWIAPTVNFDVFRRGGVSPPVFADDNRSFSGGASPSPTAIFSLFTFHSSLFTLHFSLPYRLVWSIRKFVCFRDAEDVIPYAGHIISLLLGTPGTSPPTRFVFSQTTFLADRVLAVPSRSRQQKRGFTSRRLSISKLTMLFCYLC